MRRTTHRTLIRMLVGCTLAGSFGLSLVALVGTTAPEAQAASGLHYQRGYYVSNGWMCLGQQNGSYQSYRCTQHWHRDAAGRLVSDNPGWVPNGSGYTATSHAQRAAWKPVAPARRAAPVAFAAAPSYSSGSVADQIRAVFGPYADQAIRVATCESSLNPSSYNGISIGGSHATGVFQILYPSTWNGTSYAGSSPYDASANIHAAYQIFARDGYSWREWSCQP